MSYSISLRDLGASTPESEAATSTPTSDSGVTDQQSVQLRIETPTAGAGAPASSADQESSRAKPKGGYDETLVVHAPRQSSTGSSDSGASRRSVAELLNPKKRISRLTLFVSRCLGRGTNVLRRRKLIRFMLDHIMPYSGFFAFSIIALTNVVRAASIYSNAQTSEYCLAPRQIFAVDNGTIPEIIPAFNTTVLTCVTPFDQEPLGSFMSDNISVFNIALNMFAYSLRPILGALVTYANYYTEVAKLLLTFGSSGEKPVCKTVELTYRIKALSVLFAGLKGIHGQIQGLPCDGEGVLLKDQAIDSLDNALVHFEANFYGLVGVKEQHTVLNAASIAKGNWTVNSRKELLRLLTPEEKNRAEQTIEDEGDKSPVTSNINGSYLELPIGSLRTAVAYGSLMGFMYFLPMILSSFDSELSDIDEAFYYLGYGFIAFAVNSAMSHFSTREQEVAEIRTMSGAFERWSDITGSFMDRHRLDRKLKGLDANIKAIKSSRNDMERVAGDVERHILEEARKRVFKHELDMNKNAGEILDVCKAINSATVVYYLKEHEGLDEEVKAEARGGEYLSHGS